MAEFNFGHSLEHSNIETKFEVRVECEIFFKNREEYEVEFQVINQDNNSVIKFDSLDSRDKDLISKQAWNPPQSAINEAWFDFCDQRPQYDKYAGF